MIFSSGWLQCVWLEYPSHHGGILVVNTFGFNEKKLYIVFIIYISIYKQKQNLNIKMNSNNSSVISFCFCVFKLIIKMFWVSYHLCFYFKLRNQIKKKRTKFTICAQSTYPVRIEASCVIKFKVIINYFFQKCSVVVGSFFLILYILRKTVEKSKLFKQYLYTYRTNSTSDL